MGQPARQLDGEQLLLRKAWTQRTPSREQARRSERPLCAGCREREARYGFRPENAQSVDDRPSTLCFECFRIELGRRQEVAARRARGWDAEPVRLPLEEKLRTLTHRRRRAQIAARHELDLK